MCNAQPSCATAHGASCAARRERTCSPTSSGTATSRAQYAAIKDTFAALKRRPDPDLIFTHQCEDRHQDHRLIGELTWNAFRGHLVLEYEIPKYEGGLTTPNVFVPLSRSQVTAKIHALLSSYVSQRRKRWFSADTFEALMRLRGVESGAGSGWAEGFHVAQAHPQLRSNATYDSHLCGCCCGLSG